MKRTAQKGSSPVRAGWPGLYQALGRMAAVGGGTALAQRFVSSTENIQWKRPFSKGKFTKFYKMFTKFYQMFTKFYQMFTKSYQMFTKFYQMFTKFYQIFTKFYQMFTKFLFYQMFTKFFKQFRVTWYPAGTALPSSQSILPLQDALA